MRNDFPSPSFRRLPRFRYLSGGDPRGWRALSIRTAEVASAVLRHARPGTGLRVLDYGCGAGRIARALIDADASLRVIGVDESEVELRLAEKRVASERFLAIPPGDLRDTVDVAFLEGAATREDLERIYFHLAADGAFVRGYPVGPEFDALRRDVARLFVPLGELFDEEGARDDHVRYHVYRRKPLSSFV